MSTKTLLLLAGGGALIYFMARGGGAALFGAPAARPAATPPASLPTPTKSATTLPSQSGVDWGNIAVHGLDAIGDIFGKGGRFGGSSDDDEE